MRTSIYTRESFNTFIIVHTVKKNTLHRCRVRWRTFVGTVYTIRIKTIHLYLYIAYKKEKIIIRRKYIVHNE